MPGEPGEAVALPVCDSSAAGGPGVGPCFFQGQQFQLGAGIDPGGLLAGRRHQGFKLGNHQPQNALVLFGKCF